MGHTILFVSYEFKPDLGGTAELSHKTALAMHKLGHEVLVVTRQSEAPEFDRQQPIEIIRNMPPAFDRFLANVRELPALARFGREFRRLLRERGVEYILCTESLRLQNYSGYLRGRALDWGSVPTGLVFHGMDVARTSLLSWLRKHLFQRLVRKTADLFTNSHFTANLVRETFGEHLAPTVIGCGITPEALPPRLKREEARQRLSLGSGPMLLTIGRLVSRKGIDTTIQALPAILEQHPDTTYIVAGAGPDLERLKALAKETGCERHVRFEGAFDDALLASYYSAADVFVMPNRDVPGRSVEGFGIVFLEAGHYELPVVGGRAGGVPDAIMDGTTGLLVNPGDPEDLAEKLLGLLGNPDLCTILGRAGHERAHKRMTWDAVAERLEKTICATISARKGATRGVAAAAAEQPESE